MAEMLVHIAVVAFVSRKHGLIYIHRQSLSKVSYQCVPCWKGIIFKAEVYAC